jgi:hypothetical protein
MYVHIAQSTSSTSLAPKQHQTLELCIFTIVSRIHSVLAVKSDEASFKVLESSLQYFTSMLLDQVKARILELNPEGYLDPMTDWDTQLLRPIVADFDLSETLGTWEEAEYILLLSTVLMLAYELLLLAGKSKAPRMRSFLSLAFRDYFVEPKVFWAIEITLETERVRLAREGADMAVLRAIHSIRVLLPYIDLCTVAWEKRSNLGWSGDIAEPRFHDNDRAGTQDLRKRGWNADSTATTGSIKQLSSASRYPPTALPQNLYIRIFLKLGYSWPFDYVTSIEFYGNKAIIESSTGLSMQLEEGCSIVLNPRYSDAIIITAHEFQSHQYMATIIVPPCSWYPVTKVLSVNERTDVLGWTLIETDDSILNIGNVRHVVRQTEFGNRVLIGNLCV